MEEQCRGLRAMMPLLTSEEATGRKKRQPGSMAAGRLAAAPATNELVQTGPPSVERVEQVTTGLFPAKKAQNWCEQGRFISMAKSITCVYANVTHITCR